jgi:hypothetical protein
MDVTLASTRVPLDGKKLQSLSLRADPSSQIVSIAHLLGCSRTMIDQDAVRVAAGVPLDIAKWQNSSLAVHQTY